MSLHDIGVSAACDYIVSSRSQRNYTFDLSRRRLQQLAVQEVFVSEEQRLLADTDIPELVPAATEQERMDMIERQKNFELVIALFCSLVSVLAFFYILQDPKVEAKGWYMLLQVTESARACRYDSVRGYRCSIETVSSFNV